MDVRTGRSTTPADGAKGVMVLVLAYGRQCGRVKRKGGKQEKGGRKECGKWEESRERTRDAPRQ